MRIGTIRGSVVTLHCLTGFGGAANEMATSRSFALSVLLDAARRPVSDVGYETRRAPPKEAKRIKALSTRVKALAKSAALIRALPQPEPWEKAWQKEHAPRFIVRTSVRSRSNDIGTKALLLEYEQLQELEGWEFLAAAWRDLHHYDLEVEVCDAKYLAHLVEGVEFGTTSWDTWNESDKKTATSARKSRTAPTRSKPRTPPRPARIPDDAQWRHSPIRYPGIKTDDHWEAGTDPKRWWSASGSLILESRRVTGTRRALIRTWHEDGSPASEFETNGSGRVVKRSDPRRKI